MKFGIFYELSVPRPWDAEAERSVYMNALEQVRLADELGFEQVWAVEHHFLEEYSHCSSPELFLTTCAMQTKQINVGHGIVICVPEFNHPIRIAERAAVLDILSGGRLQFGTGRSATWTELGGFRASPDETAEVELENPEHISGADITYLDSLHLARVQAQKTAAEAPVIVRVDPEYVFHTAQRGKPRLITFKTDAWGDSGRLHYTTPIVATMTKCDTDLPQLRFALDPSVPAAQGSRRLAA